MNAVSGIRGSAAKPNFIDDTVTVRRSRFQRPVFQVDHRDILVVEMGWRGHPRNPRVVPHNNPIVLKRNSHTRARERVGIARSIGKRRDGGVFQIDCDDPHGITFGYVPFCRGSGFPFEYNVNRLVSRHAGLPILKRSADRPTIKANGHEVSFVIMVWTPFARPPANIPNYALLVIDNRADGFSGRYVRHALK